LASLENKNNKVKYREALREGGLLSFEVKIKETNLLVRSPRDLEEEARKSLLKYREELEKYILEDPKFQTSFKPYLPKADAPSLVKEMAEASSRAGVGPMASVAGAIAECVGRDLLKWTSEIIVENGGDIFLQVLRKKRLGILAGDSSLSQKIALEVKPEETPLGICTSSGTVGHSLSFGKADAVVVTSFSTPLADALATAVGNRVKSVQDIQKGLDFVKEVQGVKGVIIVKNDKIGVWGDLKVVKV
jgi:ApbE superfamily uncharacterized protein (UPF0280 family)